MIESEDLYGGNIFRSLIPTRHVRALGCLSTVETSSGPPFLTKLHHTGVDVDPDLYDRNLPQILSFEDFWGAKGFLGFLGYLLEVSLFCIKMWGLVECVCVNISSVLVLGSSCMFLCKPFIINEDLLSCH